MAASATTKQQSKSKTQIIGEWLLNYRTPMNLENV